MCPTKEEKEAERAKRATPVKASGAKGGVKRNPPSKQSSSNRNTNWADSQSPTLKG